MANVKSWLRTHKKIQKKDDVQTDITRLTKEFIYNGGQVQIVPIGLGARLIKEREEELKAKLQKEDEHES